MLPSKPRAIVPTSAVVATRVAVFAIIVPIESGCRPGGRDARGAGVAVGVGDDDPPPNMRPQNPPPDCCSGEGVGAC